MERESIKVKVRNFPVKMAASSDHKILSDVHVHSYHIKQQSTGETYLLRFFFSLPKKSYGILENTLPQNDVKVCAIVSPKAPTLPQKPEVTNVNIHEDFGIEDRRKATPLKIGHNGKRKTKEDRSNGTPKTKVDKRHRLTCSQSHISSELLPQLNIPDGDLNSTSQKARGQNTEADSNFQILPQLNSHGDVHNSTSQSVTRQHKLDADGDLMIARHIKRKLPTVCHCCRNESAVCSRLRTPDKSNDGFCKKRVYISGANLNVRDSSDSSSSGNFSGTQLSNDSRRCWNCDMDARSDGTSSRTKPSTSSETETCCGENCVDLNHVITLDVKMEAHLKDVGYQVWTGALLLCDYLIETASLSVNKHTLVLDLGSGSGITSIVTGMFFQQVICTDYRTDIVKLAEKNWLRNEPLLPQVQCQDMIFKVLDWTKDIFMESSSEGEQSTSAAADDYTLKRDDLTTLESATLILGAEVIYDDDLTDDFFKTIYGLLVHPPAKQVLVSLERRIVFTTDLLEVCSPAYEHFRENVEDLVTVDEGPVRFSAEQLDTSFPQYFQYNRTKGMELWSISSWFPEDPT